VREYLRDNSKMDFNVETVAEEMNVDIRDVQDLVDMGYLDRDLGRQASSDTLRRQKLAKEFENSLKQMKEDASKGKAAVTYGQQRYGDKDKKKGI